MAVGQSSPFVAACPKVFAFMYKEMHMVGRSFFKLCGPAVFAAAIAVIGCGKAEETKPPEAAKPATVEPAKPIIPVAEIADWCPEHHVPESVCTRCNESLVAAFKAKGDWDEQHNLPKSQCFVCDPSLKDKFAAAYKEKYGKEPPAGGDDKH